MKEKSQMETLTIELSSPKALKLLEDLEALNLIKVVKRETSNPTKKLSDKYSGQLTQRVAEELQNYVTKSREEWDNRSI